MPSSCKIMLLGPQGSGKGTQAIRMAESLGVPAISVGQLLRDEVSAESDVGKKIAAILEAGTLVPARLSIEVLEKRLAMPDAKSGFIVDGFPRNREQYDVLTPALRPTDVFVLDIPESESLRRIGLRLTCGKCGRVESQEFGFKPGQSHDCGGTFESRSDDTPEALQRRLGIYRTETIPVIQAFEKDGIVRHIDGIGGIEEVSRRMMSAIEGVTCR